MKKIILNENDFSELVLTDNGVRVKHISSGIEVIARDSSNESVNREAAYKAAREELVDYYNSKVVINRNG